MISKLTTSDWLLITLLIFSPLYFHSNIGGTGLRIPNNIITWSVASIFICWSLLRLSNSSVFFLPRYYLSILAFPVLVWFSSFFAGVEIGNQWLFRLLFIWGGVAFLFALLQLNMKQAQWDRLLCFILFAGLFHSLVGVGQIVFITDMPTWLPINPNGEPTGFFQQINNQASFQVTVIIIALWLNTRPIITHAHRWRFYFSLCVIALSSFIVAYSGSRVGALGFLIASPLLMISRWGFIKKHAKRWTFILVTLITAATTANVIEQQRGFMSVAQKTAAIHAGYSASARLGIYSISLDLIKEAPVFGHGIGSFVRVWQYKKPEFYINHPEAKLPKQRVSHPHNELLFWLVEAGLLAGAGLIILFVGVLVALLKLPFRRCYAYMAMLMPIALHTQVELPFYIASLHWFLFLSLLGLVLSHHKNAVPLAISSNAQKLIKMVSIGLLGYLLIFFVDSYKASLELKQFESSKQAQIETMNTALNNAYFKQLSTDIVMFSLFQTSLKEGLKSNVKLVAEWAEETVNFDPHPNFFRLVIDANLYLKNHAKACDYAMQGNELYPRNTYIKQTLARCIKTE